MDIVSDILEHHGTKGMKWGVRRAQKQAAKAENKWGRHAGSTATFIKIHNAAADEMNSVHIDRINNMPKYKNVDLTKSKNKTLNDQYMNEYAKTWNSVLAKHSKEIAGTSPAGRRFVLSQDPVTGTFSGHVIEKTGAQHADTEPTVLFLTDDTGHVTEVKIDTLSQTAMLGEGVLEHFGIKGMRWGVRRQEGSGGTIGSHLPSLHKHVEPSHDAARAKALKVQARKGGTQSLSNKELRDLNERMNLEQQYSKLTGSSTGKARAIVGGKFIGNLLLNVGRTQASDILNQKASAQLVSLGWKAAKGK
jgi:hypothetical protein